MTLEGLIEALEMLPDQGTAQIIVAKLRAGQMIVDRIKSGDVYYMEAACIESLTETWDAASGDEEEV